ncbi:hypothetical protein FRX31_029173 [Thalictrum thalictroides]|uniref:Uncharacterized protein n=1 Tax=Thalictrum thalictroides TaxID=46969 RepID=A0A7J6V7Z6_THATH|nr:hypothetical protein FRX31_029173 [Thalictrum thalictroides]
MAYSFSSQNFTSVNEVTELENFSISKLVAYLKSSFRKESFKDVEKILSLREEKLKSEKEKVVKHVEGLEEELRDYKDRFSKLLMRFGNLESAKAEVEAEFKEKVKRLSELENVSKEKNKELIELKTKIKEMECAKQKVDNELDTQKRKCKELEKENDAQKIRYIGLVKQVTNLEKECMNINLKLEVDEVSEKEGKIDETNGGENRARLSMLNMKENTSSRDERVHHSSAGDFVRHSLAEASGSGQAEASGNGQAEGPPTVNLLSKSFVNQKEERKCLSSPKLVYERSIHENVIEITDSESEDKATSAEKLPTDCVIKTSSSPKDIENGNSRREKYPSVSSCKRRRMVVSSDSEDDD